jgi:glycogen(starch) synthase
MRILIVSNCYPPEWLGGYELGCSQMALALAGRGHSVRVLTSSQNYPTLAASTDADTKDIEDVEVRRCFFLHDIYRSRVWGGPGRDTEIRARAYCHHNVAALIKQVDSYRPDIAYLFNTLGLGVAGIVSALNQQHVPWVWHLMDRIPALMYEIEELFPFLPGNCHDGRAAVEGDFVACSRGLIAEIKDARVDLVGPAHIVPNWIDVPIKARRPSYYEPRRTLRVCFAGSLTTEKGVNHIIDGIGLLQRQSGPLNVEVELYGQGDTSGYSHRLWSAGLGAHVRFKGPVTRNVLLGLFPYYDLMLFPTWAREPFAFAPMEAASQGCIQAFPHRGNAEWLVDGVDCLKFARTPEGVAGLLAAIQKGAFDFKALAANQARTLDLYFRLEAVAARVERLLTLASKRLFTRRKRTPEWSIRFAILAQNLCLSHAM